MCEDRTTELRSPYADYSRGRHPSGERHRDRSRSPLQAREDIYSASLRLASLETLTGKQGGTWPQHSDHAMALDARKERLPVETPPSVPISLPDSAMSNPLNMLSMPGSPFSQLLGAGGVAGLSGLPKPSDLLQHAQALQLLAHLQTMLLSPGQTQPNMQNIDMQKVNIIKHLFFI